MNLHPLPPAVGDDAGAITEPLAAALDAARLAVDEIRLVGSRCGPFRRALEPLASGSVEVESPIDARYGLDDGVEGFERSRQAGVLKVLLDFGA